MRYWFSIGCDPNPDIIAIAKELRSNGVRCYLATNQEKYRAEYLRSVVGLKNVFDELFVSADLGFTKDDIRYFQAAYDRVVRSVGVVQKEHVLFVDHEEKNLAAAESFGFQTYAYHDAETFRNFVFGN